MFQQYKKLWIALIALIIISPLGTLTQGTAFGEWGADELKEVLGFVPQGFEKMSDLWSHVPLPDYSVPGLPDSFMGTAGGYILSAVVGVGLILIVIAIFSRFVKE
ncbi:MAG TPA: PDGLE domain-containing protein [Syntrophomonadaceae bacterium]|nr:PDGLE domain-containing protein [Syntrophomonadaceae bacterium]